MSRYEEFSALREQGLKYREIAEMYGCTHQNVECVLNYRKNHPKKEKFYKGLGKWMDDNKVGATDLAKMLCSSRPVMYARLSGRTSFKMEEIKTLLDITGLTYEQLFLNK